MYVPEKARPSSAVASIVPLEASAPLCQANVTGPSVCSPPSTLCHKNNWFFEEETVVASLNFVELASHTADVMANIIKDEIENLSKLQEEMGMAENVRIKLTDLFALSFDWTNSNTGETGGLKAKLDKMRKAIDNKVPPLQTHACNDHLINTLSTHSNSSTLTKVLTHFHFEC